MGETAELIRLENVDVRFGEEYAVKNLTLSVRAGERIAILGTTGAGKSTALALIAGGLAPTAGRVTVAGIPPADPGDGLQGKIATAFQQPSLLPWRTALQNVSLGLQILHYPRAITRQKALDWLDRVGLAEAAEKYPYQLSGGMRQRVSLARALVVEPELLLLDEAFSALDEHTAAALRHDFKRVIYETDVTSVLVTHRIEEAFEMSDRVLVFASPAKIAREYQRGPVDFDNESEIAQISSDIRGILGAGKGSGSDA